MSTQPFRSGYAGQVTAFSPGVDGGRGPLSSCGKWRARVLSDAVARLTDS